jgi:effector-binding domain-containing protein
MSVTVSPPRVVSRDAQPYVALAHSTGVAGLRAAAHSLPDVFAWLARRGEAPAGPPFFRYLTVEMPERVDVEVGVPLARRLEADDGLVAGTLPAGEYATLIYHGAPSGLVRATAVLLEWGAREDVRWDAEPTAAGERWASRLEIYRTDPAVEPDPDRWETELAFKLA